jgi:hemerythrin
MREEIAAQHRRLDGLFEAVRDAFSQAGLEVDDALARLGEALEAHFEQEDRLYYPTIGSLRPEHRASVERFASDHQRFLAQLATVAESVRHRELEGAAREFEAFAADFVGHEAGEESLLRALEAELAAAS